MDKQCSECKIIKPIVEFYPKRAKCKQCICARTRKRGMERYRELKESTNNTATKRCSTCMVVKEAVCFPLSKGQCTDCINSRRCDHRTTDRGQKTMQRQNKSKSHAKARLKWQRTDSGRSSMKRRNSNSRKIRKEDPGRHLEHNIMVKVRLMVKGTRKGSATVQKHTGFRDRHHIIDHLQSMFTEDMSFDNYGRYGWHVGHRIPRSAYDKDNPVDVLRCWNPDNIFPQWGDENISLQATLPSTNTLIALRHLWPISWNDTLP